MEFEVREQQGELAPETEPTTTRIIEAEEGEAALEAVMRKLAGASIDRRDVIWPN